jgi:transposase
LEIDNHGAERSLQGVTVGRKNWTFLGSDNGGRPAAVLTSLIATCKRLSVAPFAYLRDLIGRIAAHPKSPIAELLTDQWRTARRATADF